MKSPEHTYLLIDVTAGRITAGEDAGSMVYALLDRALCVSMENCDFMIDESMQLCSSGCKKQIFCKHPDRGKLLTDFSALRAICHFAWLVCQQRSVDRLQ
jgi:hypothetical protein